MSSISTLSEITKGRAMSRCSLGIRTFVVKDLCKAARDWVDCCGHAAARYPPSSLRAGDDRAAPHDQPGRGPPRQRAGLERGDVGIEVFQAELQLAVVEALRPASEAATLERFHDLPQPVDRGLGAHPLAVEGSRQFAARQGSEVYGHERILSPARQPRQRYPADESIGRSLIPPQRTSIDARSSANRSLEQGR
jgi:hypothetical protein